MTSTSKNDWFYEDARVGQHFLAGPLTVTEEDIVQFARRFDNQPFHLDAAAARESVFGGLIASGWHTAALTMRLMLQALPKTTEGLIGRRIENIDWPHPVVPGDALSLTADILELRPTRNPARGLMRLASETKNANGKTVMAMQALIFVPRRRATPTEPERS